MEIRLEKFRHGGKIVAMGVENKWKKFRFGGEFLSGGYERLLLHGNFGTHCFM
jgi:hypothetical protein